MKHIERRRNRYTSPAKYITEQSSSFGIRYARRRIREIADVEPE